MVWIIFNLNSVNSVNSVNTPKLRNQGYFPVSQRSWVQIPYRPSFHYYLSNVHYCEDRFHIHVFNHSSNIWLSYIHNRLKDNKLGRCHNLVTEMGEFSRQAVIFRARWSCYLHILFTSRNWQNSDVEALCLWKNFCSWKKQKQKKDLGIKRGKKKKGPKTKDFEQSRVKPKFVIHRAKMRFPFTYASTSLDTWTSTIASKCYFESRLSILFLASQHILRFFHFCHGFFLWRWQPCPLLCRPPQRSTERSRWKNVSAKDHFSREILIHRYWRQEVPLSHWFAVSGGEIISERGASCLRTFMS